MIRRQAPPRSFSAKWRLREMTELDWDRYEDKCDEYMALWVADFRVRSERVQDRPAASMLWQEWLSALRSAAVEVVGRKRVCESSRSWWDDELRDLKDQRREEGYRVRTSEGQAKIEAMASLEALQTDIRGKIAAKKASAAIYQSRALEESIHDSRAFWRKWGNRKRSMGADEALPAMVQDASGTVVSDPCLVLKAWHDFVKKLGEADSLEPDHEHICHDSEFDDDFGRAVMDRLKAISLVEGGPEELSREVSWEEVHGVVRALVSGKAAGTDGIAADLIRHAGIGTEMALTELFNYIWEHLDWPPDLQEAYLVPLYKKLGSRLDPGNFRMIAIQSVVAKLFEKLLDRRLREWVERAHGLSDLQGGFREGRGTLDQILILDEVASSRLERKLPTCCAFIDVRKAYDRVWRVGLWAKLHQLGVRGRCFRLLQAMFSRVTRKIRVNGVYTDSFDVEAGVPQGSVLSPLLDALYIDGLHDALQSAGLGVRVYGRQVPLLLYADDVVLLARSPAELQSMLGVLDRYAAQWRFSVNKTKSEVVVIGSPSQRKRIVADSRWTVGGTELKVVPEYKYLGVETGTSPGRGRWNTYLERIVRKARAAMERILYLGSGNTAGTLRKLWTAEGRPLL